MAHALNTTSLSADIATSLQGIARKWRAAREKRAVYNRVFQDLATLSDRDLADIGIARTDIDRIARAEMAKVA